MQNFMGIDGFIWFTGVVEDRNDPSKLGRVRVRCVGHHTDDKSKIPTTDLPWAHVMHPVTDPSMNGMGNTPTFMVEGTWVVGFFMDAEDKQQPVIIGTLPGVPDESPNTSKGFNDPRTSDEAGNYGPYPKSDLLNESDVSRLARSEPQFIHKSQIDKSSHRLNTDTQVGNGFTDVPVPGGAPFGEKVSPYAAAYPYNHVFETESGHIKEFDDTPGEERIQELHGTSGTYYEINGSGTRTVKIVGDGYRIVAGSDYAYVDGHVNLTIGSNCSTYVLGNYDLRVDGDMEIYVKGNKKETILCNDDPDEGFVEQIIKNGKKTTSVDGEVTEIYGDKFSTDVKGKVTEVFAGGFQSNITGTYNIDVGNDPTDVENLGQITINTPTIDIETTTLNFDSTTSNITATTFNLDSSTSVNIKSAIINMDTASMDIDATDYQLNAGSSNLPKITVGAADAHALSPSVTSPSSASITLPTIANELLLTPDDNLTAVGNRLEELKSETGITTVTDEFYADAILRNRPKEIELGGDPDQNDGTEDEGADDVASNVSGTTPTGTIAPRTDYDKNKNYNDNNVVNSAGFKPYTKQYGFDEDELLNFLPGTDPRINPSTGTAAENLVKRLRVAWNKPLYRLSISSAFRSPSSNELSGGVKLSRHKTGQALDVLMDNITRQEQLIFMKEAKAAGFNGIGVYFPSAKSKRNFIHIDTRGATQSWGPDTTRFSVYGWARPTLRSLGYTFG